MLSQIEGVFELVRSGRDFETVVACPGRFGQAAHDHRMKPQPVSAAVVNLVFNEREVQGDIGRNVFSGRHTATVALTPLPERSASSLSCAGAGASISLLITEVTDA